MFTRLTAIGSDRMLALSFSRMADDKKATYLRRPPLLRKEVLQQTVSEGHYIHGYMVNSGFSSQVMAWHKSVSPHSSSFLFGTAKNETEVCHIDDTLKAFYPLDDHAFLKQMSGCRAYASTAGFESICEAIYMGKPVLMVPAHIEQECNAYDAMCAGAGIISTSFSLDRLLEFSSTFHPQPYIHFLGP